MLSHVDLILWLTVVSTFLAGLTHSLSTDGSASVLAHFGVKARVPAGAVPVMILVCTLGSGVVDGYLGGADWQHAAGAALLALMGGVFGAGVNHSLANGGKGGPPAAAGVLLLVGFVSLSACTPGAVTPREQARADVLAVSEAVHVADEACAEIARARHDAELAGRCADAYDVARKALLTTATAVDAWDDASTRSSVVCQVVTAATALDKMADAIHGSGSPVPPIVDDALALASTIGRCDAGDGGAA